jgi:hypothetical protein
MSWPDLHFHTQFLTADKTDPRVFRRAGVTTALAAYEIADAGTAEALAIADEVAARGAFRLAKVANAAIRRMLSERQLGADPTAVDRIAARTQRELTYFAGRDGAAAYSAIRLATDDPSPALDERFAAHGEELVGQAKRAAARVEVARIVPRAQSVGVGR